MSRDITLAFNDVVTDGLPTADDIAAGIIFVWNGDIYRGGPTGEGDDVLWQPQDNAIPALPNVRYWARIPVALREIMP